MDDNRPIVNNRYKKSQGQNSKGSLNSKANNDESRGHKSMNSFGRQSQQASQNTLNLS